MLFFLLSATVLAIDFSFGQLLQIDWKKEGETIGKNANFDELFFDFTVFAQELLDIEASLPPLVGNALFTH